MKTRFLLPLTGILLVRGGLALAAAPHIQPSVSFQHTAVDVGQSNGFTVLATGESLSYQWRLDGQDIAGATNPACLFTNARPADEGDYTVVITNAFGAVTSAPARLYVVPPASAYLKGNFTNASGARLPYWYCLPATYTPARSYPLRCMFHGQPGGETMMTNVNPYGLGYLNYPHLKVFASYRQQATDPMIEVWPARRAEDVSGSWTTAYLQLASGMLDALMAEFNVDTNRLYVSGPSEGVHAAWDLLGLRPGLFAAASVSAGGRGSTPAATLKDVPFWVWCAADDAPENTRSLVLDLRRAGGNAIYTEYGYGGHLAGIGMGYATPAYVDWMLAQRRGLPSAAEPLLTINHPTAAATFASGVVTLDLAGSATALGQAISRVEWTNTTTGGTGLAAGTEAWSATGIRLAAPVTNFLILTATTTSWSAGYGGTTMFNDTLTVTWHFDHLEITTDPSDRSVRLGTAATFTVVAFGPAPITYQWRFEDAPIAGGTNSALTLANVQASQAGAYTVVASDASGSVTSAPAMLTVLFDPVIVQQPCSVSVAQGGSVTLSVAVTNTATLPIGYRWRRGLSTVLHTVLNDYTSFLTVTNCQTTTNYQVMVTNLSGFVVPSSNAVVTVLADEDGDGLPDAWEADHGICQTNAQHGLADDDGDGLSNLQEYLAGTDPTNALSYLKVDTITLAEGGSTLAVEFRAVSNQTYTVQYRSAVESGAWNRLADVTAASTNRVVTLRDPAVGTFHQRVYRLATPRVP